MSASRLLIVGIGSPHGDDRAGWQIAERVARRLDDELFEVRQAATPSELLDWLGDAAGLIVCDACRGLARVGAVRRWQWPSRELASVHWSGTHDLTLPAVLALAGQLGRLPQKVSVWSVEAAAAGIIAAMSAEVEAALPEVCRKIIHEAHGFIAGRS